MNPFTVRESGDGCTIVRFDKVHSNWEQWFLLSSDRHWDSTKSDRAMQKRHLDEAVERNALVMDFGDWFDLMGGKDDRRGSKGMVRPEHQVDDYFSAVIRSAVDWAEPYAKNFLLIGEGNHETAARKHHEIDPTGDFVRGLNDRARASIIRGCYAGWVKLLFGSTGRKTYRGLNLYYHHGSGGSSPVTKGVIQTNRRAVYLPDANVVVTGHIHQHWLIPITRERLSDRGVAYLDTQMHVSLPTYKQEGPGRSGWAVEKGFAPTITGAVWLRLYYHNERVLSEFTLAQ